MKRIVTAAVAAFLLTACGATGTSSSPTTHGRDELEYLDPVERDSTNALAAKCTEDAAKVHAEARKTLSMLNDAGIHDETVITVLQHVDGSIPDSAPKMSCGEMFAAYLRLREG